MSETQRQIARGIPRLFKETSTGHVTVREVFPPRRALARGRPAMIVTAITLAAFGTLFVIVRRDRSRQFDVRATRALQRVDNRWFDRLMRLVSWPGFPPQSRIIPPALSLAWFAAGFPLEAAFQLAAWGTGGISAIVKRTMRRPRPAPHDVRVFPANIGGTSFPSGHVLIYSGVYGFLAFLLETLVRPQRWRRITVSACIALLALVGPSRVYLGHHWLTDISASYLLGASYLLSLMALYRRAKTRWLNRRRIR